MKNSKGASSGNSSKSGSPEKQNNMISNSNLKYSPELSNSKRKEDNYFSKDIKSHQQEEKIYNHLREYLNDKRIEKIEECQHTDDLLFFEYEPCGCLVYSCIKCIGSKTIKNQES